MTVNEDIHLDLIIGSVASDVPTDQPLARLTAARSTAVRLENLAQHLVAHYVDEARRGGSSWTDIGAALGVTRQAAQQRFVPAPGAAITAITQASALPLSARARTALETAQKVAAERYHSTVDDIHILLALLESRNSGAIKAVKALGLRVGDVRKVAKTRLAAQGPKKNAKAPTVGRTGARVLQLAARESLRFGRDTMGSEHLLLGLAGETGTAGQQALTDAGVEYADLRAAL